MVTATPCFPLCLCLQDVAAIRKCKRRVFQLHAQGKLQAWVDESHGFRGVGQIPDAIDYMLQGGHIGKVVIPIQ
jgi:NADPH-dependent curcumin reductase CurA